MTKSWQQIVLLPVPRKAQSLGNKSYFFPFLARPKSWQQIGFLQIPHMTQNLGNTSYFFPFLARPRVLATLLPIPCKTKVLATNRISSNCSRDTKSWQQIVLLLVPRKAQGLGHTSSHSLQDQNLDNKADFCPFPTRPLGGFNPNNFNEGLRGLARIPRKTKVLATNRISSNCPHDTKSWQQIILLPIPRKAQSLGNKSYFFPFLARPKSWQQIGFLQIPHMTQNLGNTSYFFPFLARPRVLATLLPIPCKTKVLATNRISSNCSRDTKSWQQIVLLLVPRKAQGLGHTSSHSLQDQNLGNKADFCPFPTRPLGGFNPNNFNEGLRGLARIPRKTKVLATNRISSNCPHDTKSWQPIILLPIPRKAQRLGNKSDLFPFLARPKS